MQKQKGNKIILVAETSILIFIWLIIFTGPMLFQDRTDVFDWEDIYRNFHRFVPYLILLLFNHFVLVPYLFFKNRMIWYFLSSAITIILFVFILNALQENRRREQPRPPVEEYLNSKPPPRNERDRIEQERVSPEKINQPRAKRPKKPGQLPPYFNLILIPILIVGFDTGLRTIFKWTTLEKEREVLEKEKLQTELAFLKNQVSPHFFMNTLNNIHALIDIDSEDAKASIIKLSKLMRYLLYDSEKGKTTLAKEIEFIKSYVDLMKLRFTDNVKIVLSFPESIPDIRIQPMLFTSLVENAFKHGVSYQKESFIEIIMNANQEHIFFRIKNSKQETEDVLSEQGGIGLENLQKRLDILYGKKYILDIEEGENTFGINIKLPLND